MAKKFPLHPANPERICWGCEQFCAIHAMACSNERSPHPAELFGDDWLAWGERQLAPGSAPTFPCTPTDKSTKQAA
jgi:hypothetical protein